MQKTQANSAANPAQAVRGFLRSATGKAVVSVGVALLFVILIVYLGSQKNFTLPIYIQLALDGLRGGTIYALIALGFVTIFNVTGIINFAQGAFAMLGAMIAVTVNDAVFLAATPPALRLIIAGVVAVLVTTLVGIVMERLTIYPARDSEPLTLIIITVGVFIIIQGVALAIWGTSQYTLPAFTTLEASDEVIRLALGEQGTIIIRAQSFWIWGTAGILMAALWFFFERTMIGKALKACSVNRQAASLMGISPSRMSILAFAIAAAAGAIGGFVLAPATRPIYDMGLSLGLKGFIAAIMGGLVNPAAAVVGGLMLGVFENVGAGVTRAGFRDVIAFVVLILLLLFRPQGLFTRQQPVEKV